MGRPDALDSVRVLAVGFLLIMGVAALPAGRAQQPLLEAVLLVVPLVYARVARLKVLATCGFVRMGWRATLLVLLASLGSMWVLKCLADAQETLLPRLGLHPGGEIEELTRRVDAVRARGGAAAVLALGIVPALCEEAFFRGLVLRGFLASFGPVRAVIYTTLLFAAIHPTLVQAVMMLFTGAFFGVLVWLTGSVWAGVLAHFANNAVVLVLTHVYAGRMNELRAPPWLLALSSAVLALALTLLALERRGRAGLREART